MTTARTWKPGRISRNMWLTILCIIVLTPTISGFDVDLRYVAFHKDWTRDFQPGGVREIQKSAECPMGFWSLPPLKSIQPIYGIVSLGEQRRLLVLDRKERDDVFFNRIYFDSNGNRNVADDPILDATLTVKDGGANITAEFPAVDTTVTVNGSKLPYSFLPRLHGKKYKNRELDRRELNDMIQLGYKANCIYTGEFSLEGTTYHLGFEDRNANGVFGEKLTVPPRSKLDPGARIPRRGDWLYLTQKKNFGYYDSRLCTDWLCISGTVYRMDLDLKKSVLSLVPLSHRAYPLKLAGSAERLTLYREDGTSLSLERPGDGVAVPSGGYRLLDYVLLRKDGEGDLWRAEAVATAANELVTVGPGRDAVLKFAEPFRPFVDVPYNRREALRKGSKEVPLEFHVSGAGGEIVEEFFRVSGKNTRIPLSKKRANRPAEPTYEVLTPDGETVVRGKFEYG